MKTKKQVIRTAERAKTALMNLYEDSLGCQKTRGAAQGHIYSIPLYTAAIDRFLNALNEK